MFKICFVSILVGMVLLAVPATAEASLATGQAHVDAPPARISASGRVTDSQGKPIEDAKVTLYQATYGEMAFSPQTDIIQEKNTGADGTFGFTIPKDEDACRAGFIVARKEELALGWAMWQMQGDQRFDIVLGEPKSLAGEVVDENGRPIAEAEVSIAIATMGKAEDQRLLVAPGFLKTKTDNNGHFLLANMPAEATCEFLVEKRGRATLSTFAQAASISSAPAWDVAQIPLGGGKYQFTPGQTGIKLTLPLEARVEGLVVEKTSGRPVGGMKVTVRAGQRQNGILLPEPVTTAEDGTFRIVGLAAGNWSVQLAATNGLMAEWVAEPVWVALRSDETASGINLQLTKGGIMEVSVRDAFGKPVRKANVDVCRMERGQYFSNSTDDNGLARIRVPAGQYDVWGLDKGYAPLGGQGQVIIEEGQTKRVEYLFDPPQEVAGTVRDAAGAPLAGVKILVTPVGGPGVVTNANGEFALHWNLALPGAQATTHTLVARDMARNLADITEIDQQTKSLDLKLKPAVILTGTVLNQEGKPLAGAGIRILLRGADGRVPLGLIEEAVTRENGAFEIKAIPPGRQYVVTATAAGYGMDNITIDASKLEDSHYDIGQLKLVLADLSISGIVVDTHGKPVAGVIVFIAGGGSHALTDVRTDTDGKFVIKGVSSSLILVMATTEGPVRMHGSVWTKGGATDARIIVAR